MYSLWHKGDHREGRSTLFENYITDDNGRLLLKLDKLEKDDYMKGKVGAEMTRFAVEIELSAVELR
ncbi:hypothetical protein TELCIR_13271, partial [Teladorsagia circumcincta]